MLCPIFESLKAWSRMGMRYDRCAHIRSFQQYVWFLVAFLSQLNLTGKNCILSRTSRLTCRAALVILRQGVERKCEIWLHVRHRQKAVRKRFCPYRHLWPLPPARVLKMVGSADYGAHIRHRVDQPHRHDAVISGFGHDKFSSVVLALILLGANAG